MQFKKIIFITALLLSSFSLLCVVVVDFPTVSDQIGVLYKKMQDLQKEFPALIKEYRCDLLDTSDDAKQKSLSEIEPDQAWARLQKRIFELLCNFDTMRVKIQSVAKNPTTTDQEYVATLISTLNAWEATWRSAQVEIARFKKA